MTPLATSIANATPARRKTVSPWPDRLLGFVAGGLLGLIFGGVL